MKTRIAMLTAITFATTSACASESTTGPSAAGSLIILPHTNDVFEGDVIVLDAIRRDADGRVMPYASFTWKSRDENVATVNHAGQLVTLKPGIARVEAASGDLSAELSIVVRPLTVLHVSMLGIPSTLAWGDVLLFGVKVEGQGGRIVSGREVTLTSSDPGVALIDPSGRIRAVSPGRATITATAGGVSGAASVTVSPQPATHPLRRFGDARVPAMVDAQTVVVNGVGEQRETWLEWGSLTLTGGGDPGYATCLHYVEYRVTNVAGMRQFALVSAYDIEDRGVVRYDGRGDLVMTSELRPGQQHVGGASTGGFTMRYRSNEGAAGSELFFRREPD